MLLRAKWVVPITAEPILDGAVLLHGDRIEAIGQATDFEEVVAEYEVRDLGEAALLPGLVNTHSHLELTAMRGLLEEPGFREWIGRLTELKLTRMDRDDLLDSARAGALEAVRAGITCCADTCDSGLALNALLEAGLRGVVFQEVFGSDVEQARESLRGLSEKVARLTDLRGAEDRVVVGVSPHAPYTVSARLFEQVTRMAVDQGLPMAIHAAESDHEEQFVRSGTGPFAERLRERDIVWRAPKSSTIEYLASLGVLDAAPLLIHAIRATERDMDLVAASGTRIAHCPKSNAKFGHGIAPVAAMLERGIAVGLGTDSVVSNNTCDLLSEARHAAFAARIRASNAGAMDARTALEMATIGAARALGLGDEIGSLEVGKRADLCAVSLDAMHLQPVHDVVSALVFSASARDVLITIVDGSIVYDHDNPERTLLDEERLRARLDEIRTRLAKA